MQPVLIYNNSQAYMTYQQDPYPASLGTWERSTLQNNTAQRGTKCWKTIAITNSNKLQFKLGPWKTSSSMSLPNHMHQQALFIWHLDGIWYQHQRSTSQRRTRAFTLTFDLAGCAQQQLPSGAIIADVRKEGGKKYM